MHIKFFQIEYQDWDENGNPLYEIPKSYINAETGKQFIYRTREKAKEECERLSTLTRTFNLHPLIM